MRADDNSSTLQRIREWNATRLDLFKISEPNKRNEFHGVVRFFFQGDDLKYQAKCLRISNTTTACQLVNTLVEKFFPDLKMLTAGRFALYEYHTSSGERRLGANEAPLLVQLNYAYEDHEVRFILRDESKPIPTSRHHQALENQPGALQNGTTRYRSSQKLPEAVEEQGKNGRGFARRWSSGSRKKKKRKEEQAEQNGSDHTPVPDSSFTRTLSNPDEVLRRRKQQRMQNRLQSGVARDERVDTIKIYGDSINPEVPSVTLSLTIDDVAEKVVEMALEKYGLLKQVNPKEFCLVQVNIPPRGERLPLEVEREMTLHNQDSPIGIRLQLRRQREDISCIFQLRHRRALGKDGRKPPAPAPVRPRAPPSAFRHSGSRSRSAGPPTTVPADAEPVPYLIEVNSFTDHSSRADGLVIPLKDLFNRTYPAPIQLGTIEKMVGPPPNILVDKNIHPDIRPVHCTLSAVLASNSGSKWSIPKSGQPGDFDAVTHYSLLLTPSLDGFAKPPGPAQVRVNGQRITGPMLIPPDGLVQLGKAMFLKFVYLETDMGSVEEPPKVNTSLMKIANGIPGAHPSKPTTARQPGGHSTSGTRVSQTGTVNGRDSTLKTNKPPTTDFNELPLTIELQDIDRIDKEDFLEHYAQLVDQILDGVDSDLHTLIHRTKDENRPVIFSLSPAYALYLVYRACEKHMESMPNLILAEKEHNVSYITNYIATRVYESLPSTTRSPADHLSLIQPLVYWLANSSELLQFFKNDISLCSPSEKSQPPRSRSPIHACRQALHLLADAVDHCFYELRTCMTNLLQPLLQCLIYPGDSDLQEDLRLDDRPINLQQLTTHVREPVKMQTLMQLFSWLMHLLRRTRVNASLTIQLFAQLFHTLNAYIFNHALINTEARPRHARDEQNVWLTRLGATRLTRRLERIKQWAQRFGLERAAECRLQRCVQACQLIQTDRSNLDEFYQFCMELLSLNSIQLEWLLAHLADPPPVPDDWIDLIVTGGKEVNDRAILDEMDHYMRASQQDLSIPELQLSEMKDLPLPLLLPPDGYASDAILTGTPSGLSEFLRPLVSKGFIFVRRNPVGTGQTDSRPWMRCLRLSRIEDSEAQSVEEAKRKSQVLPSTSRSASQIPTSTRGGSDESGSEMSDTESAERSPAERRVKRLHYQPRTGEVRKHTSGQTARQHRSMPDLAHSDFDWLAKEANVPVRSITRFYLRKHNNSLGLSIVAAKAEGETQYGIYVKDIVPGGAADRDGRLDMGDQILAIGSANLVGCAQSDAVATLAKQSQSEEGVQLTVAQGAAKSHGILELIRPSEQQSPGSDGATTPTIKPRHSTKPSTSDGTSSHSALHKVGATVHPPSTRMGLKPASQQHYPYGTTKASAVGRVTDKGHPKQFGALSRSTPTLNLADIDDAESEGSLQAPENVADRETCVPQEPKTWRIERKGPVDGERRSDRTKSMQLEAAEREAYEYSDRRHRKPLKRDEYSPNVSPGSDFVHEDARASKYQTGDPSYTTPRQRKSTEPKSHRPKSGVALQTARSQPDMSHPSSKQQAVRRSSLSTEPAAVHTNRPQADSDVSDVFSSLESVSSQQTPCSLQDSAEHEQERLPSNQEIHATATHRDIGWREDQRVRHPPPPSVAGHKAKPPISKTAPHGRTGTRHLSESELTALRKQEFTDTQRPHSATQKQCQKTNVRETDVDMLTLSDEADFSDELDRRKVQKGSRSSLTADGGHHKSQADQEDDAHFRSATPATSGSMTPTSVDTVVSKTVPPKSIPISREHTKPGGVRDGSPFQAREPTATSPDQRKPVSSIVADVSHPPPRSGELPTPVDEAMSESLRPPSHAIVSGPRWTEEQLPSYTPALLPDVPVLHSDPQRGRSKRDLEEKEAKPQVTKEPVSDNLVHAEFVPRMALSDSRPPLLHPTPLETPHRKSLSIEQEVDRRSYEQQRYTQSTSGQVRDYSRPISKPSGLGSPPPTPTAECPQYHPPERLEPVDWTSERPIHGASSSKQLAERYERSSGAPQIAPKPHVSGSSAVYHQPHSQGTKPAQSPSISQPPIHPNSHTNKPTMVASPAQTQSLPSGAAQRVAQLEAEIAAMENRRVYSQSGELSPTLDRLRVELQFQKRLAERESLRKHPVTQDDRGLYHVTTPMKKETSQSLPTKAPVADGIRDTHIVWEEKRIQAERELEASQRRRLAELEEEHRAMLARQEQRARERAEWFGKHHEISDGQRSIGLEGSLRLRSHSIGSGPSSPERASIPSSSDTHGRYGRPRFDANQRESHLGHTIPQYPVQSRSGPQVVETELTRPGLTTSGGVENLRMKKSVSFDKNLETITVYSPPTTPQESFAENAPQVPSTSFIMDSAASFTGSSREHSPFAKGPSTGNYAKSSTIQFDHNARQPIISPNPIPNAELLPFKEKMRLFAQQIGEDTPKERSKLSSRQKELLMISPTGTARSSTNNIRPSTSYPNSTTSKFQH